MKYIFEFYEKKSWKKKQKPETQSGDNEREETKEGQQTRPKKHDTTTQHTLTHTRGESKYALAKKKEKKLETKEMDESLSNI